MIRWFWYGPKSKLVQGARHFEYRPAHPVMIPEHGPDVPAGFFMVCPLPVITAGAFGRAKPDGYLSVIIQQSRS